MFSITCCRYFHENNRSLNNYLTARVGLYMYVCSGYEQNLLHDELYGACDSCGLT